MLHLSDDQIREDLLNIYMFKSANEKLAWSRKRKKLEELLETLEPINDSISELTLTKQKILDEVNEKRKIMVKECVHPKEFLLHKQYFVECKFCNAKINLNRKINVNE